MTNPTEAESGLARRDEGIASFEQQITLLSRLQHALHSSPALVPLIVLVLSIVVFGALLGG
jgi:fructose transport system permease protein